MYDHHKNIDINIANSPVAVPSLSVTFTVTLVENGLLLNWSSIGGGGYFLLIVYAGFSKDIVIATKQ